MLYHFYEWNHAALAPLRAFADATRLFYQSPLNPFAGTEAARTIAAMAEVFERSTRIYGKPEFGLHETVVSGVRVPVVDKPVWQKPFGRLLHFERELPASHKADPRILIVAPMSGHYATLLRGTVEALLPYADVYITDWTDARTVPVAAGRFDLDDYVDYVVEMLQFLGPDTHVIGVCQPAVPVLMAVAVMEAKDDPCAPATMTLMGGPIDTRINPTAVNKLAMDRGIGWFRDNVVMAVPFPQPGFMRQVYPGFLQLSGFMSMNLDRHLTAHREFYQHLVKNDGDSAEKHREFYDEYMAVMDLTAEFYLQTVEEVFIKHSLPKGEMTHRGARIDTTKIRRTALFTVEGENDDISGVGQTEAAHRLCSSIPDDMRVHYLQPKVGHYGVFNGSRFRAEIAPRIIDFALTHGKTHAAAQLPRRSAAPAVEVTPALPEAQVAGVETATQETADASAAFEAPAPAATLFDQGAGVTMPASDPAFVAAEPPMAEASIPDLPADLPAAAIEPSLLASNENLPAGAPFADPGAADRDDTEQAGIHLVHDSEQTLAASVAAIAVHPEVAPPAKPSKPAAGPARRGPPSRGKNR